MKVKLGFEITPEGRKRISDAVDIMQKEIVAVVMSSVTFEIDEADLGKRLDRVINFASLRNEAQRR